MRTTIDIDERLLIEVKTEAVQSGRTIGQVIEAALRETKARRRDLRDLAPPELPRIRVGGLQPGIDLDDSAALLDLMEGER